MKTILKFVRPCGIYSRGDVAGFDAERAESLVKVGAAEPFDVKAEDSTPAVEVAPESEPAAQEAAEPTTKPGRQKKQ